MVSTLTRALWDAEILAWIWGPREQEDHVRIFNMLWKAEAVLPDGDPALAALHFYRDLAEEAIVDNHAGCLPIWGGPVVFDRVRDTSLKERQENARRLRHSLQFYLTQPHP